MHSRSSLISGLGLPGRLRALGRDFLVPAMLPEFSPLQITFGRFVLYGVVARCVFCPRPQAAAQAASGRCPASGLAGPDG
jgi:hypothetical protein